MTFKKIFYLVPLILILVSHCGCLAAYGAASMAGLAGGVVDGLEKTTINAAVSPGVTVEQLSKVKRVAFLFGKSGVTEVDIYSTGFTDIMADNLAIEMMKMGYECMNEATLKKNLEGQGLNRGGALNLQDAIKAGKNLGIQAIITGSVKTSASFKGSGFIGVSATATSMVQSVTMKIIGTETGESLMVISINYKKGKKPDSAAKSMAKILKAKLKNPFGGKDDKKQKNE